jgi:hypothetical protein
MGEEHQAVAAAPWRLNVSDFQIPERPKDKEPPFSAAVFHRGQGTSSFACSVKFSRVRFCVKLTGSYYSVFSPKEKYCSVLHAATIIPFHSNQTPFLFPSK